MNSHTSADDTMPVADSPPGGRDAVTSRTPTRSRGDIRRSALGIRCVPLALLLPASLGAQAFDRSTPPPVPAGAELVLPPIRQAKLPNGVSIRLVEMHEVPLVQVTLRINGGARLDGDQPGLASFTANLLDEGAGGRTALALAEQAAFLGADLDTRADWDHLYVTLNTPKRTLGEALDLMTDVALRPAFASADVQRERDLRIARILQQRDEPGSMGSLAFGALVYPPSHPYHRPLDGDSAATARLDSAMVRGFYHQVFRPDQAEFVVTGDITLTEARTEIARRFGRWIPTRMTVRRPPPVPPPAPPARRAVFLVDKPGAAQSMIMIGAPGVERSTPDYAAIEVMNTILGGSFSSRLNQNLRETRGYTYGAGSQFVYRPVPGPFVALAAVRTDVTDSALVEFFKELNGMRDTPVGDPELARARNYIVFGLPGEFETTGQMAGQIGALLTFGLPPAFYGRYVKQVLGVTAPDVQRVARRYIDPDHLAVVMVGGVAKIRAGIEALNLGPVSVRDLEGREVNP